MDHVNAVETGRGLELLHHSAEDPLALADDDGVDIWGEGVLGAQAHVMPADDDGNVGRDVLHLACDFLHGVGIHHVVLTQPNEIGDEVAQHIAQGRGIDAHVVNANVGDVGDSPAEVLESQRLDDDGGVGSRRPAYSEVL